MSNPDFHIEPNFFIDSKFLSKKDLLSNIDDICSKLSTSLIKIDKDSVAVRELERLLESINDDLICFMEFPYVEKIYRDSFYSFFSKKHSNYNRDSIRISFFKKDLENIDDFYTAKDEDVNGCFLGYITLRPTTHRIIGNSFLNPLALKNHNFVCCLCKKTVLINGRKLSVNGFPYSGQDGESITCAEVAILNIMDYFGHKYPEYSTILPSQISRILSKLTHERQLPSTGLSYQNISYALKKLGFGTKIYSYNETDIYAKADFREYLYTYLESGIPVILLLTNGDNGHAVLAIGRKDIDSDNTQRIENYSNKTDISFSDFFDEILVMNDNDVPYKLVNYENPIDDFQLSSFIVPLNSRIYVDACQFKELFYKIILELLEKGINLIPSPNNIFRYYLTASKSYKNYIAQSEGISLEFKKMVVEKTMPKFIWVGEIISGNTLNKKQNVEGIIAVDATETGLSGLLMFAANSEFLIMKQDEYFIVKFDNKLKFNRFAHNLKGEHLEWKI